MYVILLLFAIFISGCIGATIGWDTTEHTVLCISAAILLGFAPQGIVSTFGLDD